MLNLFKKSNYKVVDTSIFVDGRIIKLLETGFLEGDLIIPKCVVEELQNLADCSDGIKRKRGRRGLEILESLTKDFGIGIYEKENRD